MQTAQSTTLVWNVMERAHECPADIVVKNWSDEEQDDGDGPLWSLIQQGFEARDILNILPDIKSPRERYRQSLYAVRMCCMNGHRHSEMALWLLSRTRLAPQHASSVVSLALLSEHYVLALTLLWFFGGAKEENVESAARALLSDTSLKRILLYRPPNMSTTLQSVQFHGEYAHRILFAISLPCFRYKLPEDLEHAGWETAQLASYLRGTSVLPNLCSPASLVISHFSSSHLTYTLEENARRVWEDSPILEVLDSDGCKTLSGATQKAIFREIVQNTEKDRGYSFPKHDDREMPLEDRGYSLLTDDDEREMPLEKPERKSPEAAAKPKRQEASGGARKTPATRVLPTRVSKRARKPVKLFDLQCFSCGSECTCQKSGR